MAKMFLLAFVYIIVLIINLLTTVGAVEYHDENLMALSMVLTAIQLPIVALMLEYKRTLKKTGKWNS